MRVREKAPKFLIYTEQKIKNLIDKRKQIKKEKKEKKNCSNSTQIEKNNQQILGYSLSVGSHGNTPSWSKTK